MTDRLIVGTAYFLSIAHAVRYYRKQNMTMLRTDVSKMVTRKIADHEIFIGEPKLPENAELVILDDGCRYGIETPR